MPGGAGTGTPFSPFGPDLEPTVVVESDDDASAAADFREGTDRGRKRPGPSTD
jgi:hypothetical protein